MASVNRPTNVKQKEDDVNQKLQLYGIYSGMWINRVDVAAGRVRGTAIAVSGTMENRDGSWSIMSSEPRPVRLSSY